MEVKNAFSPGGPAYMSPPEGATDVRSISPTPPEPGRNTLNPYLPGTRAFTERVNAWEPPNPLTTKPSGNYMYDVGAAAPIAVERAFSKIAAKALPAKAIETKLLQAGASKAELEARGVLDYLESQGTRQVSPAEVMKYLDENLYQLKEVVKASTAKGGMVHGSDLADNPKFEAYQTPGGENYREILMTAPDYGATAKGEKGFIGGHWDEPNVLAHMRVNDRTLPSGEKALHVEEWQSDWANEVRKQGKFRGQSLAEVNHPLVDNWQDLMARRTLKEAADGRYDRLTWTTGQQQADRYDLSKQINKLEYKKLGNIYEISAVAADGGILVMEDTRIPVNELDKHFGKEIAKRMVENERGFNINTQMHELSGLDLKVGGEWATKLYDESMVNRFNKIGKRYGVQVEDLDIAQGTKHPEAYVHSLKITPEMRKAIGGSKFHPFADLPGPK